MLVVVFFYHLGVMVFLDVCFKATVAILNGVSVDATQSGCRKLQMIYNTRYQVLGRDLASLKYHMHTTPNSDSQCKAGRLMTYNETIVSSKIGVCFV